MSPAKRRVMEAIEALTDKGVSPSLEEITAHLGLKNHGNVHRIVGALIEDGHLTRTEGRARSLRIVGRFDADAIATMPHADVLALKTIIDRRLGL